MCVCVCVPKPFIRKSSLCHAHLRNRIAMVAMRFDVGGLAAEPLCSTAPLSTSRRRRAQRARAHARVVLGVVRAVEALHGIPRGRTSHSLPTEDKADITPEDDSAATDVELGALHESQHGASMGPRSLRPSPPRRRWRRRRARRHRGRDAHIESHGYAVARMGVSPE